VISPNAVTAWRTTHPWADDEQVEQDLIMTRVAIEIANNRHLGEILVWRGGTCLHKLFLPTALRYSEDLDYVAYGLSVENNDMRHVRTALRDVAQTVGLDVGKHPKTTSDRLNEHFTYTSTRSVTRRLKVEINLDEVPAIAPLARRPLTTRTDWFSGSAEILTFQPVELLATKFRALAQRRKGRDLNDLDVAHKILSLDDVALGTAAAHYLLYADITPTVFRSRLAAHGADPEFIDDTRAYLIGPTPAPDPAELVNRWILWSDRYLDLPHALRANETAPSKRKQRAIDDIRNRLLDNTTQCPAHTYDNQHWRRCDQLLGATHRCPLHR
jgi:predicted nucleotidyltransferase component of viral defense system